MKFEWDEQKRLSNMEKHGGAYDFRVAVRRFDWGGSEDFRDPRLYDGEARWRAVGLFGGSICSIAYTDRSGARRLISFRLAGRKERRQYYERKKSRHSG